MAVSPNGEPHEGRSGEGRTSAEGEKTLEEVGEQFKVSRERVRQLENKALRKLRKNKELKTLLSLLTSD